MNQELAVVFTKSISPKHTNYVSAVRTDAFANQRSQELWIEEIPQLGRGLFSVNWQGWFGPLGSEMEARKLLCHMSTYDSCARSILREYLADCPEGGKCNSCPDGCDGFAPGSTGCAYLV